MHARLLSIRPHTDAPHDTGGKCALHEQIRANTTALHLNGRRTCAGQLCSRHGRLTPSCGPVDGRVGPHRAAARRRRRAAVVAAGGAAVAAADAAVAELLGTTPATLAAADLAPVRIEVRLQ